MDFIIVFGIGAILVATGVVSPKPKDDEILEEVKAVKTEEIVTPSPEPEPEPEPEPVPEPEPEPEPEPATEPEPTSEPQKEEPKEQINSELIQEQDAKPEEEEVTIVAEEKVDATEENGISVLNIILYILGAIAVIAAGIYFFMRRDPAQSAADIAREQTSLETSPEPEEETKQEEPHSEPEPKEPAQEGTQTESTQEETPSDNTDNSSSNEDENNNK